MAQHARRLATRFAATILALTAVMVILAPGAGADGVRPGNFESRVESIEPRHTGVKVDVLGGDSFLRVTAEPGTKVLIPGYDEEPYLRIDSDGTVYENKLSPATYINARRDGNAPLPERVSSKDDPEWAKVADDGTISWHDHRIHWMGTEDPPVANDGLVRQWSLPLTVNGAEVTVSGTLFKEPNLIPWPGVLIAVVAGGALALTLRRSSQWRGQVLMAASLLAFAVSMSFHVLNPPGAQASLMPIILPVLAFLATALRGFSRLPTHFRNLVLPLVAAAALVGWAVPLIGVLWMPLLPSTLPAWFVRVAVSLVIGVTLGVVAAIIINPPAAFTRATSEAG